MEELVFGNSKPECFFGWHQRADSALFPIKNSYDTTSTQQHEVWVSNRIGIPFDSSSLVYFPGDGGRRRS
jgi:hypothetical protein